MAQDNTNNKTTEVGQSGLKPESELNWFDIKVILDPAEPYAHTVAEPLVEESSETNDSTKSLNKFTSTRFYGKGAPIILFNTIVLNHDDVEHFTLYYDDFTPYLDIIIDDPTGTIKTLNVPGMSNVITLIMLPWYDGKYKSIKVDFYIETIRYMGRQIMCTCKYKNLKLSNKHTQQLVFHFPDEGCQKDHINDSKFVECPSQPNAHPTTFELLHVIAEETGLGFAATDQCASVKDDKSRVLMQQSYEECIKEHVAFGGTDEDNIFDTWIDLYGYITLVNVPWLMTRNIDINNIASHAEIGLHNIYSEMKEFDTNITPLMQRVITNMPTSTPSNICVEHYENIVRNTRILDNGTNNTYYDMNPLGAGGGNTYSTKSIQIIENSLDGKAHSDEYRFDVVKYRGAEMGSTEDNNFPCMNQKSIHDSYFARIRANAIKVKMHTPNFGLMRGTLITFLWLENDPKIRNIIAHNAKNATSADTSTESEITPEDEVGILSNPNIPIINPFVSGIYYIDGMIFEYEHDSFEQYLILIKKDGKEDHEILANVTNKETMYKSYEQTV